jgi:hypothetical protein
MRRVVAVLLVVILIGCSGEVVMDTTEPWDLVWFSDSTGFGVADLWAERIEQELGVEVRVHDFSSGGLSANLVHMSIDYEDSERRALLSDAEVVLVFGNPVDSGYTADEATCVSTSTTPRDAPSQYTKRTGNHTGIC